jgi:Xaa-Pro aminopeptidase
MWIDPAGIRVGADADGIAEVLRQHGLQHAPAGVLGPGIVAPGRLGPVAPYPPWRDVLVRLPHVRLKPVGQSFLFATACLSEEELAVVRYCAAAGEAAARAMAAAAAPGATEAEVCAAGTAAAFRLGCPVSTLMWSGPGFVAWGPPSWSYRPEPPRALEEGDVLLAEIAPRFGMKETRHPAAIAIGGQHPDIETAAVLARASYQAGLCAARVGNTFGDLAEAMLMPLKQACSWNPQPLVRMLSAPGPAGGFGGGLGQLPQARRYGRLSPAPAVGGELPLAPGMCCAFGPSAVVAGRAVSLGGTVLIGEDDPIELSPFTARMLRVPAARRPAVRRDGGTAMAGHLARAQLRTPEAGGR